MDLTFPADPVPIRVDTASGGALRIGNTRVTLGVLVSAFQEGLSPAMIVEALPTLQLADVYGAIAYYLRHQAEVDAFLAERDQAARALVEKMQALQGYDRSTMRARLLARRAAQEPLTDAALSGG